MKKVLRRATWLLFPLLGWLIVLVVLRHNQIWWWFEVHSGTVNEAGPYYGFWSGFGSDIGEYVIAGSIWHGLYMHWRHINCKEPRCWRIGHFEFEAEGVHYKACHIHHPGMPDTKPTKGHMARAWEREKNPVQPVSLDEPLIQHLERRVDALDRCEWDLANIERGHLVMKCLTHGNVYPCQSPPVTHDPPPGGFRA